MFAFLLATVTAFQDPYVAPESTRRHCAAVIGIPINSDDFSEAEWHQWLGCIRDHLRHDV